MFFVLALLRRRRPFPRMRSTTGKGRKNWQPCKINRQNIRRNDAEKAALSVGRHPWNGGELILSRWDKPVEIVPWERVADDWVAEFRNRGVEFDIVPPKLLPILAERGVEILPPHKGMGKRCEDAYKAWKNENPDGTKGGVQAEGSQYLDNADGVRSSLPEGLKRMDDYKERREREIDNIIVDKETFDKLPTSRKEATEAVAKMQRPFINKDQQKEILVSNSAIRHSATQDHTFADVRCMGIVDRIIENAIKIGEIPVKEGRKDSIEKVEVYYCPVNLNGAQHSARLLVNQYKNRGVVLEDFQLYDIRAKEKTGAKTRGTGQDALTPSQSPVSRYKVKELIHSSQEYDKKLLEIGSDEQLKFSLTEEQREAQTHSDNFKRWFGDWENDPEHASKVVDEEGKPLVMTHNTDNEFYTFDRERIGSGQGQAYLGFGFNFSRGRNSTYGNNAMQVYLDARNPLESDGHKLTRADLETALRQIDDGETDTVVAEFAGEYAPFGSRENPDIRFSLGNTIYSNAARAVEGVKQEKAKAEQWKAMLTKAECGLNQEVKPTDADDRYVNRPVIISCRVLSCRCRLS